MPAVMESPEPVDETVINPQQSQGHPLPDSLRSFYEAQFQHDFGEVRIHTGASAGEDAARIHAQAYTHGQDIYFAAGRYKPDSLTGQRLITHELTHTVQQSAQPQGGPVQARDAVQPSDHPLEREAEWAADQVIRGQPLAESAITRLSPGQAGMILRQVETVERPAPTYFALPQSDTVASASQEIIQSLQVDPADRSGRVRRRLSALDFLTQQIVLAQVRDQLPPQEQAELSRAIVPVEEEAQADGEEENREGSRSRERDRGSSEGQRTGHEDQTAGQRTAEVAAGEERDPEVKNRQDTAERQGRTQALLTPQPPAQAGQAAATQAVAALETRQMAADQETTQAQSVQAGALEQSAGQGQEAAATGAEATQEVASEAEGEAAQSVEQSAQAEQSEGLPSLRTIMEEAPNQQAAPDTAETAGEEQEATGEEYDPAQGQAAVAEVTGAIQAAAGSAGQTIMAEADATRASLTASANSAKAQVRAQVEGAVASVTSAFATARASLDSAYQATSVSLGTRLSESQTETQTQGTASRENLSGLFSQHRANVETLVDDRINASNDMTERHVESAGSRTDRQINQARSRGRAKANGYPDSERGDVQRQAVLGVARETAEEMESRKPDTEEAIREITTDIPDEIREQGDEALNGFDEGLPDLLAQVDQQVLAITENLQGQFDQAAQQMEANNSALMAQLETLQSSVLSRLQAIQPQAEAQVDAALQAGLAPLNSAPARAGAQINQVASEAVQILNETERPDPENTRAFGDRVLGFIEGSASDAAGNLQQAATQMGAQFGRVAQASGEGVQTIETEANSSLQTLEEEAANSWTELETTFNDNTTLTLQSAQEGFTEVEANVGDQLQQALADLGTEMTGPIDEAEEKVREAENEGLEENDNALGELEEKMEEAADDAAWEHDHPNLAALRDIGAFIAGAVLGILAVLALVVVVIVAFKVGIALLVAAGVSLAVAKLIALVVGLGLLAYGLYSAYQETGSLGGAVLRLTGIENIVNAFTQPGLSPFEAGLSYGQGVGTLATFFIGRGMGKSINARFARIGRLPNPAGRVARFVENPRAVFRPGQRLFTRLGGGHLDRAIIAGENRLGRLVERGGQVFGRTRVGRGLSRAGEWIDNAVEGAFQDAERTRPVQAVTSRLFGSKPSTPAYAPSGGQTGGRPQLRALPPPEPETPLPTSEIGRVSRVGANRGEGYTREGNVIRPERFNRRPTEPPSPTAGEQVLPIPEEEPLQLASGMGPNERVVSGSGGGTTGPGGRNQLQVVASGEGSGGSRTVPSGQIGQGEARVSAGGATPRLRNAPPPATHGPISPAGGQRNPTIVGFGRSQRRELYRYWSEQAQQARLSGDVERVAFCYRARARLTGRKQWRPVITKRFNQSEEEILYYYRQIGGQGETPYIHGRLAPGRPEGHTRPDFTHTQVLGEVKRVDIQNPSSLRYLFDSLDRQIPARRLHGPATIRRQTVVLDLRGLRGVTPSDWRALAQIIAGRYELQVGDIQIVTW
jgi:hypothetical protein